MGALLGIVTGGSGLGKILGVIACAVFAAALVGLLYSGTLYFEGRGAGKQRAIDQTVLDTCSTERRRLANDYAQAREWNRDLEEKQLPELRTKIAEADKGRAQAEELAKQWQERSRLTDAAATAKQKLMQGQIEKLRGIRSGPAAPTREIACADTGTILDDIGRDLLGLRAGAGKAGS